MLTRVRTHGRKLALKARAAQVVALGQGVASEDLEPATATEPPDVSVVIPIYNEEATVESLYRSSVAVLERLGRSFELIVVDDGSTDRAWEVARALNAADPRLRGVRLGRNLGQHTAMRMGFSRARGNVVVTLDTELRHDIEGLPRLIATAEMR